jgi:hypothetical protein
MKKLEKLILPGLVIIIIAVLFFTYFAPTDELGSFSSFDPNNNASLPILVKLVAEKGINKTHDGSIFFVVDKTGREVRVSGPAELPIGIENSNTIEIIGHLSGDGFHAHGVELKN